jgi:hypothetical protein
LVNRCERSVSALACLLLLASARVEAQKVNLAAVGGIMSYDFGGDHSYFAYGLQARYFVSHVFRVGLVGSTAHIGDPLRIYAAPGTDEQIFRVSAMAEITTKPFHRSSFALRGILGVFNSSGLIYQGPEPGFESFWAITDTKTGVTYGGGIGFEIGPYSRIRFYLQGNYWLDHAYGATGNDPEFLFGVGVDL